MRDWHIYVHKSNKTNSELLLVLFYVIMKESRSSMVSIFLKSHVRRKQTLTYVAFETNLHCLRSQLYNGRKGQLFSLVKSRELI